jgi:hypothetical protein
MPRPSPQNIAQSRQTGTLSRSTETKSRGQTIDKQEATEKIPSPESIVNPAYVVVKGGMTINTGNFESARIDVSISMPCLATQDEVMKTYKEISAWVDDLLTQEEQKVVVE